VPVQCPHLAGPLEGDDFVLLKSLEDRLAGSLVSGKILVGVEQVRGDRTGTETLEPLVLCVTQDFLVYCLRKLSEIGLLR